MRYCDVWWWSHACFKEENHESRGDLVHECPDCCIAVEQHDETLTMTQQGEVYEGLRLHR